MDVILDENDGSDFELEEESDDSTDWEYESEVWFALSRMLMSFTESGYLGIRETILEFPQSTEIPQVFRDVATWE